MGWELIDRPKTHKVTKALAKSFAEMEPAPHDRPLSERRLQVYQKLLADGKFRPVTWASAICKETGDVYRVNGKHTSVMLSGLDKLPEFYVVVEEYECETLEDVGRLYATFDSAMQSRTARDIYLSFAATAPELAEVYGKVIALVPSAVAYAVHGEGFSRTTPAERAENLLEHPAFVVWLDGMIKNAPTLGEAGINYKHGAKQKAGHLLRVPVAAAMFKTFEKSVKAATEFWTAVRDETGARPEVPDRKLSRYLLTTSLADRKSGRNVKTGSNRELFVKCLHAWNAWRKGETTNLNYYSEAKIPAVT